MQQAAIRARGAPTLGEALRGLVAFLLLVGVVGATAAALLFAGDRPGPPPSWPTWEEVRAALASTDEPPLEATRYVASMAGWALLAYVALALLLRAAADTLVSVTRGVSWAQDFSQLVDVVTLPWVKRGLSGGLMAVLLAASLVKVSPELPKLSLGGGGGHAAAPLASAYAAAGQEAAGAPAAPEEAAPQAAAAEEEEASQPAAAGEVALAEEPAAPAPAPAAQGAAPEQGRARPELPAPAVALPGSEQAHEHEEDEPPPGGPVTDVPGVRLPSPDARR